MLKFQPDKSGLRQPLIEQVLPFPHFHDQDTARIEMRVAVAQYPHGEFQALFAAKPSDSAPPTEHIAYLRQLKSLANEFTSTAERIGRTIIEEVRRVASINARTLYVDLI